MEKIERVEIQDNIETVDIISNKDGKIKVLTLTRKQYDEMVEFILTTEGDNGEYWN